MSRISRASPGEDSRLPHQVRLPSAPTTTLLSGQRGRPTHEVDAVERLEREAFGGALGDVELELRPVPSVVLLFVDVEGRAGDLAEQPIVRADDERPREEADRGAAVTAAPRLHEHQRAVPFGQLLDRSSG